MGTALATDNAALAARLDRLPVATRTHRRLAWLLGYFFLFDLFDLSAFGYTAPAIRAHWKLTLGEVGLATSVAFLGMLFGAVLGGRASDRWGRKPVLIAAAVGYSLCSLLTGLAPNFAMLVAGRLLTGMGLQAMTGVLLVVVSEMFPSHLRGRYQSVLLAIGISGVPVSAFVAWLVIPTGAEAWRWVYVIGSLGIVGVFFAVRFMPESPRWQAMHGRGERARGLVERLEAEAVRRTGEPLAEPVLRPVAPPGRVRELATARYLKRTVVASIAMILLILSVYGFNSWVATLLVERGHSQSQALTIAIVLAAGSVPGALAPYPVVDRYERKTLILVLAVIAAASVLTFGLVRQNVVMVAGGFLFTMAVQAIVAVLYTYLPEIYPTQLRVVGSGITNGLGRVAGIAGAFMVTAVFTAFGFTAVFVYLSGTVLLLGIVLAVAGEHTTNRALEEISR
ncbi:MFS transporter [Amycolatopsis anabasis]|uniref:MFS transporter n=1 Tax=Amycolatopsis anabasis TaxID=1840409 RepID=UPI00131CBBD9|nr:MFS transporter [Amycolatopsis anabasis]